MHELRCLGCRALDCLCRGHAVPHQHCEFLCRICGPGKCACICAEGDFDVGLHGALHRLSVGLDHLLVDGISVACASFGDSFQRVSGWDVPDALCRHCSQVFRSDVVAVFERVHPCRDGVMHAVQPHCMCGDRMVLPVCLIHDGIEFIECEGGNIIEHAIWTHEVSAIYVDLDPIGAVGDLFAHRFTAFFGAVAKLHSMWHVNSIRVSLERICACHIEGACSHLHSRAGDDTCLDEVLDVHVGIESAFSFEVTNGGEAVIERSGGVHGAHDAAIGLGLLEKLLSIFGRGRVALQQNVCVG